MENALKKAKKLMKNSPVAQALAIKAINAGYITQGFEAEKDLFGKAFGTEDFKEGTTAFVERRRAEFSGK